MAHKLTQFEMDMRTLAVAENMARKHSEVFTVLKTVLQVCNGEELVSVATSQVERIMGDYPTMVQWGDTYLAMFKSAKFQLRWETDHLATKLAVSISLLIGHHRVCETCAATF